MTMTYWPHVEPWLVDHPCDVCEVEVKAADGPVAFERVDETTVMLAHWTCHEKVEKAVARGMALGADEAVRHGAFRLAAAITGLVCARLDALDAAKQAA